MLAAGLIEMPPVSNVMPLPTSATFFGFLPFAAAVRQPHQPGRTRRALADADDAAVTVLGQRLVVEHLDLEPGRLTQSLCALGEFGGEQVAGRGVDEIARGGDRGRDRLRAGRGVLGRRLGVRGERGDLAQPGVLGRGLVAAEVGEPVGAEDQPLDRGLQVEVRQRGDHRSRRRDSDRAATPAARRIVSAGHSSRLLPSPTASTLPTGSDGATTRVTCSLPALGAERLQRDLDLADRLGVAGTESATTPALGSSSPPALGSSSPTLTTGTISTDESTVRLGRAAATLTAGD